MTAATPDLRPIFPPDPRDRTVCIVPGHQFPAGVYFGMATWSSPNFGLRIKVVAVPARHGHGERRSRSGYRPGVTRRWSRGWCRLARGHSAGWGLSAPFSTATRPNVNQSSRFHAGQKEANLSRRVHRRRGWPGSRDELGRMVRPQAVDRRRSRRACNPWMTGGDRPWGRPAPWITHPVSRLPSRLVPGKMKEIACLRSPAPLDPDSHDPREATVAGQLARQPRLPG